MKRLAFALWLLTSAARADGVVEVRVVDWAGRPADGSVRFTGPKPGSCNTVASRCTLRLPAGKYQASLAPRAGKAPPAKALTVAASGTTKLVLAALEPSPAAAPKSAAAPPPPDDEHDAVRKKPPGRNLAQGKKVVVDGRVLDASGRPCDALIVLLPKGKSVPVGHVGSVAGRFSMRDVSPGAYTARVYKRGGGPPSHQEVKVASQAGKLVIKVK